jgi:hypothetical protein
MCTLWQILQVWRIADPCVFWGETSWTCCNWVHSLNGACATGMASQVSWPRDSRDEGYGDLEPNVGRRLRYLAYGGTLGRGWILHLSVTPCEMAWRTLDDNEMMGWLQARPSELWLSQEQGTKCRFYFRRLILW